MADGTKQKVGYRYRLGGGVFVWPGMEKVYVLPMDIIPVTIRTPEVLTHGGVPIMAEASAQVKIDSSDETIHRAAEQFLGIGRDGIRDVAVNVLEGKVREVIGGMSVEEIYRGRQEFSSRVVAAVKEDFARMGLAMLSFALKDISDTQGYIDSLSKPQIAAAKRDAAIAQAETEKESIIKSSHGPQGGRGRPAPVRGPDRQGPVGERGQEGRVPGLRQHQEGPGRLLLRARAPPPGPGPEAGGGQGQAGREGRGHQDRAARDRPQGEGARGDRHQAGRRPQVPDQVRGRGRGVSASPPRPRARPRPSSSRAWPRPTRSGPRAPPRPRP
ncbi:MAG: flotillin family protein [Ignavibacteriales bacterium]|nr:flotillin family protein [Ignavibacteriales bacterium]